MISIEEYFSVQAFLIILRETLESAIIISVLLAFLHQTFIGKAKITTESTDIMYQSTEAVEIVNPYETEVEVPDLALYKSLKVQVWIGGLLGIACCLVIGAVILAVFYILGSDLWAIAEHYWEGTFSIFASVIISVMGIKILRVNKMQEKWKYKLGKIFNRSGYLNVNRGSILNRNESWVSKLEALAEKYNMFILPFVTTLREGMEAIVFLGGIGINENTSVLALVNSAIAALVIGSSIGMILYRSGNTLSLQWFLVSSTCFLYLVAAGLFSKGVWNFELQSFINSCGGLDVSETGHGPGSYDINRSVWHVNCCNGEMQEDGAFWMIFTAIFGWTNSATYGSVIAYNIYWMVVITVFSALIYEEKHGYLPLVPASWQVRRARKRNYQTLESDAEPRVSTSSINSETPLK